jgi:hypothetical protein
MQAVLGELVSIVKVVLNDFLLLTAENMPTAGDFEERQVVPYRVADAQSLERPCKIALNPLS